MGKEIKANVRWEDYYDHVKVTPSNRRRRRSTKTNSINTHRSISLVHPLIMAIKIMRIRNRLIHAMTGLDVHITLKRLGRRKKEERSCGWKWEAAASFDLMRWYWIKGDSVSDPHVIAQSLLIGKEETQLIASSCLCAAILIMRTIKRKGDFIKRSYRAKRNINSRSIPDPGRRVLSSTVIAVENWGADDDDGQLIYSLGVINAVLKVH